MTKKGNLNKSKDRRLIALLFAAAVIFLLYSSMYIVKEGEQAIVLQFGKPIGDPITEAGLKLKTPFIQNVVKFEKRILEWDGDPTEIPLEGKYILVDAFARWEISDPQSFYKSVTNISNAQSRLDDIINGVVRDEVSDSKLRFLIPNTIFNNSYDKGEEFDDVNKNGVWDEGENFVDVGEDRGRQAIVKSIVSKVQEKFNSEKMGIRVVDIQIKRINYTDANRNSVFKKIESGQNIKADLLKSEGEKEAKKIRGDMVEEEKMINSEAYRESERIKGLGDSIATKIYREAYSRNPEFYDFYKALNSLEAIIGSDDKIVLTTNNDILYLLKNAPSRP